MWYRLILLLLCSAPVAELAAEKESRFAAADSLCAAGKYREAALAYERIYFQSSDTALRAQALLRKGRCLKNAGNYAEAVNNLKRSDTIPVSGELFYRLRYETALCAYLAANAPEAAYQLAQVRSMSDTAWRDSCLVLQVLVDMEQENWERAGTNALRCLRLKNLPADTLQLVWDEKELGLKDATKARRLSLILPGLGQAYAGKPLRGAASFVLVAGSLAYGTWTVLEGYYISGTVTGLSLATRFYGGGAKYAARLAEEYNAKKKTSYKDHVRKVLLGK